MLCSIIIPTVNRPSFERALKSALEQELDPELHEIIVVNDSGKPLPDADWLKSPQIKIINTNKTERSVACNAGAAVATGKYLKVLQDDDYLFPGALKALIDTAERSDSAWVYGAFDRVDDDDVFMSHCPAEIDGNVFAVPVTGGNLHLSISLIRRDVFFQVGCFDPMINTSEDLDLFWRIALISEIQGTDHRVAAIRVGVWGNTTTNWEQKKQDCRLVREKALDAPGAFRRIRDSVSMDIKLRGQSCRAYLVSGILNLKTGRLATAVSRLLSAVPLASYYIAYPDFWRGLAMRSHWHENEKDLEENFYAEHHPEKYVKPQEW